MNQAVTDETRRIAALENDVVKFASLFAHDLDGPLVSMRAVLKLIDQGRLDMKNESHRSLVKSSKLAIERAQAIIQDMLKAAKIGADEFSMEKKTCNLSELIANSCHLAHPAASEQNIKIIYRLPKDNIIVQADSLLINRVVDNLIYNAIRHTPPHGTITVTGSVEGSMAVVSIQDSGLGLQGVNPEELFTVFKQMGHRTKGKHRGVGIGLYFCRRALEKMGGTISASEGKEKGSIFRFTLPVGG
ncbi:MAG: HAMP domain-containing sensor histidine kinase [Candidatus Zixiibacteriota bacterium]